MKKVNKEVKPKDIPIKKGICHSCGRTIHWFSCFCYTCLNIEEITHKEMNIDPFDTCIDDLTKESIYKEYGITY